MSGGVSVSSLTKNPLILLKSRDQFRAKTNRKQSLTITASHESSTNQLNLSVLRFTFGIPGLDESYLSRWIGFGFGSFLVLNHFTSTTTAAQLRTEVLGLALAAFSIALPYFGRFLKGARSRDQSTLPEDSQQIFVMAPSVSDGLKEDLAWATYVLLRNTNTVSVLISIRGDLCVRGYWNTPEDVQKSKLLDWFEEQIESIGLLELSDTLYFPRAPAESGVWEMLLPNGTSSLLVEPILRAKVQRESEQEKMDGFVLLASTIPYAYTDKDRAWIKTIANKFRLKGDTASSSI